MPIADLIENAAEVSASDVFDMVFHSPYYPSMYVIQCLYICYYLRKVSRKPGIEWYRSFVLGFLLSYSGRYVFGILISRILPEMSDYSVLYVYCAVWGLYNLFPFDFFYKFIDRPVSKWVLTLLSGFAEAISVLHSIWNVDNVFSENYPRQITILFICFIIPMIIQVIDNMISTLKLPYLLYPFHYLKRVVVMILVAILLTKKNFIWPTQPFSQIYYLIPPFSGFMAALKLIDLVFGKGNSFSIIDLFLPRFLTRIFPMQSHKGGK